MSDRLPDSPLEDHLRALRSLRIELDTADERIVASVRGLARLISTTQTTRDLPEVRTAASAIEDVDDDGIPTPLDRLIKVVEGAIDLHAYMGPPRSSVAILVAEDDRVASSLVVHRLKRERYLVTHAQDGRAAIEAAKHDVFDLVVLDVKMPGLDGFEVLKQLRDLPDYEHTPILMLTALGGEEQVVRGLNLGANDYITKPFSPLELVARIQRLLKDGSHAE